MSALLRTYIQNTNIWWCSYFNTDTIVLSIYTTLTMAKVKAIRTRRFKGKHPLFTQRGVETSTNGTWWESNFYYLWFEYMKRNPYYDKVMKNEGKGNQKLYRNFGDIRNKDFKTWWNEKVDNGRQRRGEFLFAEPSLEFADFINYEDAMSLQNDIEEERIKVIAIPTYLSKEDVMRRIKIIMRDNYEYDKGSRARLKIKLSARNRETEMIESLKAYDLWKKGLTLTEIGAELRGWKIIRKKGTVWRKGDTVYDIEGVGTNKLGEGIADKVQYAKALGFRMTTKGRRNVDKIHEGVFPLPINKSVSQKN